MAETKLSYKDELLKRTQAWLESEETRKDLSSLFEFVHRVALESWKNGVAAGRKRAGERPNRASAYVKGTALANGKLKPVEWEA